MSLTKNLKKYQSRNQKMINSMLHLDSTKNKFEDIIKCISDEAEQNFLRILQFCNNNFQYQEHYFQVNYLILIPGIYRIKNNTFYILQFNDNFSSKRMRSRITAFKEQYPNINVHIITYKKYQRILGWFYTRIQFITTKYKVNFSRYSQKIAVCKYCQKTFIKQRPKEKYCCPECAEADNYDPIKIAKRNYYSGYYMDIHHYVRSGWEHNFARILQWCQLDYNYENEKFRLSDGSVYIPDFYVYADDTYYEVKGELRETAKKKIELFKKDYPEKRLILVDSKVYHSLIKQFPNIDFTKHIIIDINQHNIESVHKINNINCYRANNVSYEPWELDYQYYTNRRYELTDKLINKLIDVTEARTILKCTAKHLTQLINSGRLKYYYYNKQLKLDKDEVDMFYLTEDLKQEYNTSFINKIVTINNVKLERICPQCNKPFTAKNSQHVFCSTLCARRYLRVQNRQREIKKMNQSKKDYENKIDSSWDLRKQITARQQNGVNKEVVANMLKINSTKLTNISLDKIHEVYQNLIKICQYYKLDFEFENKYWLMKSGKLFVFKLYLPADNTYYLCKFHLNPQARQKVDDFIKENNILNKFNVRILSKREYDFILEQYKLQINPPKAIKVDLNNVHCQYCGKLIPRKGLRADRLKKFCSDECRRKAKEHIVEQHCLNCNKSFPVANERELNYHQFCSTTCAEEYKKNNPVNEGTCKYCGKKMIYVSSKLRQFCSEQCRLNYTLDNAKHTLTCQCCGKTFQSARRTQKYCSYECSHKKNLSTDLLNNLKEKS